MTRRAFSLLELLLAVALLSILAILGVGLAGRARIAMERAACAHSLRQLAEATHLYLGDHNQVLFPYAENLENGKLWYFGFESWASQAGPEGSRELDKTRSPLYPYLRSTGGVEVCPAFPYGSAL